jgi:hypothetical protein
MQQKKKPPVHAAGVVARRVADFGGSERELHALNALDELMCGVGRGPGPRGPWVTDRRILRQSHGPSRVLVYMCTPCSRVDPRGPMIPGVRSSRRRASRRCRPTAGAGSSSAACRAARATSTGTP